MTNIIADVAGQYKALIALTNQMPIGSFVSLGDMVDRGPDSPKVLEFFMREENSAILGNHEHMMLDWYTDGGFYGSDIWLSNGGTTTRASYVNGMAPSSHLEWIASLPKYLEIDNCFLSHAFLRGMYEDQAIEYGCDFGNSIWDKDETTIIWNRGEPRLQPRWRLQICGHNSQFGLDYWYHDGKKFAVCLDDSRKKRLTGMVLETGEIFQQDYIE